MPEANITDTFTDYIEYTKGTEPPVLYHRWCWATVLGAAIGKKAYIDLGHVGRVFPNMYVMLLGEPAARKSTSIKMAKRLLSLAGYDTFAADKTRVEKFLIDLEGVQMDDDTEIQQTKGKKKVSYDLITEENLWGSSGTKEPREVFIVADEFNEFAGANNSEFYTTLGNLWDYDNPNGAFTHRLKNSKSVSIYQPTISILAGNTPELFAKAFPPEAIGTGFLSRLLLIYGERSGRRVAFPPPPDDILTEKLVNVLKQSLIVEHGLMELSKDARNLLEVIYEEDIQIDDVRFKGYNNRRFTQLLKLCIIISVSNGNKIIKQLDVVQASTILTHAEMLMPRAIGEFGKNKNSDVANKVMDVIDRATKPMSAQVIWGQVYKDLGTQKDLMDILGSLSTAGRIQAVSSKTGAGFLPKKAQMQEPKYVDWNWLTKEEIDMI